MNPEHTGDGLDPVRRSELQKLAIQLKYGCDEEQQQALNQLSALGQIARPLVPVVLGIFDHRERPFTVKMLTNLLVATKDETIVQALRTAKLLKGLDIWDQISCFRYGAEELEAGLLSYSWQHCHATGNPARTLVVQVLGEKGGHESLTMLNALSVELSDYNVVPGENAVGVEDVEAMLAPLGNRCQVSLRGEVLKAIRQLTERGVV